MRWSWSSCKIRVHPGRIRRQQVLKGCGQLTHLARPGVEKEQDATKSYSVKRIELMMMEDRFSFAVVLPDAQRPADQGASENNVVVGFVGITQPPEVFYIFDEKYWGGGFATEALRSFLDTYWRVFPLGLRGVDEEQRGYLEAHVYNGNDGSERVATKCGFVHVDDGFTSSHGEMVGQKIFRLQRPSPS